MDLLLYFQIFEGPSLETNDSKIGMYKTVTQSSQSYIHKTTGTSVRPFFGHNY